MKIGAVERYSVALVAALVIQLYLNFLQQRETDLLDEFMARPKNDDPLPAFSVANIQLSGGAIEFDEPATVRLLEEALAALERARPLLLRQPVEAVVRDEAARGMPARKEEAVPAVL